MSDGFGGALRIRLFLPSQNVDPSFFGMRGHPYRKRTTIFSAFSKCFDYSNGSEMSFLSHALQSLE